MRSVLLSAGVAVSLVWSSLAVSAAECTLVSPGVAGVVQVVGGEVVRSGATGLVNAAVGDALKPGTQLITGTNGSASLGFSGKVLKVGPNSTVSVGQKNGGGACVNVSTVTAAADVDPESTDDSGFDAGALLPLLFVGGAVAGGIVAIVTSGNGASN